MSTERVIYEGNLMSEEQVRNPFEVAGVPKWFWVIGIALGLLVCWLLSGLGDAGVFGQQILWPLHALVFAVFLALSYQLVLVFVDGRSWGAEDRFVSLCDHFLPEYADVANPEQVEECSQRLQYEATSVHNRRFVLMASIALPVSVVAYLIFLIGLYGGRPSYAIEASDLLASLAFPLMECMLLVMFVGITSLFTKQAMAGHAKQLTHTIATQYRNGGLARRAKRADSPPMHDLTPPEDEGRKSSEAAADAPRGFVNPDDDLPPTVLGSGAGSAKASGETGKRSRRRRGGV